MGGAVIILFFLPWLDRSPVKSIRYRPELAQVSSTACSWSSSWSSATWARSRRRRLGNYVSQLGTLVYFGFFLLMPWWSRLGTVQAGARSRDLRRPLTRRAGIHDMKKILLSPCSSSLGFGCRRAGGGQRRRLRRGTSSRPTKMTDMAALQNGAKLFVNYCLELPLAPRTCATTACATSA